jgi:hypothetical protein
MRVVDIYGLMSLRLTAFLALLSTVIYTYLQADYKTDLASIVEDTKLHVCELSLLLISGGFDLSLHT